MDENSTILISFICFMVICDVKTIFGPLHQLTWCQNSGMKMMVMLIFIMWGIVVLLSNLWSKPNLQSRTRIFSQIWLQRRYENKKYETYFYVLVYLLEPNIKIWFFWVKFGDWKSQKNHFIFLIFNIFLLVGKVLIVFSRKR